MQATMTTAQQYNETAALFTSAKNIGERLEDAQKNKSAVNIAWKLKELATLSIDIPVLCFVGESIVLEGVLDFNGEEVCFCENEEKEHWENSIFSLVNLENSTIDMSLIDGEMFVKVDESKLEEMKTKALLPLE